MLFSFVPPTWCKGLLLVEKNCFWLKKTNHTKNDYKRFHAFSIFFAKKDIIIFSNYVYILLRSLYGLKGKYEAFQLSQRRNGCLSESSIMVVEYRCEIQQTIAISSNIERLLKSLTKNVRTVICDIFQNIESCFL